MNTYLLSRIHFVQIGLVLLSACSTPQELGSNPGGETSGGATTLGGGTNRGGTTGRSTLTQKSDGGTGDGTTTAVGGTIAYLGGTSAGGLGGTSAGGLGGTSVGGTGTPPTSAACTGTLAEVNSGAMPCAATYCEALVQAQCNPGMRIEVSNCGSFGASKIRYASEAQAEKVCYYVGNRLIGVTLSDDYPHYCDNSSTQIRGGDILTTCSSPNTVCDGSAIAGTGGAGQGGATSTSSTAAMPPVPARCYNKFSGTCTPCCEVTAPDCTGKPDGYPGYACTPEPSSAAGGASSIGTDPWAGNDWCKCNCSAGKWSCAC